ncbi:MAG: DsbA family protein [Bdellovibrionales bacterium]
MRTHTALVVSHRLNNCTRMLGVAALVLMLFVAVFATSSHALSGKPKTPADAPAAAAGVPERVLGKANAPVTLEEFASLTCSHCADFYTHTLPELEKRYVDTGKVKIIFRDFPLDGTGLKAAAIARCMPAEQYYPFIATLYKNLMAWSMSPNPEEVLAQYAKLGGLSADKAKSCLSDNAMFDAIIAVRNKATEAYGIEATPVFILNGGVEKIQGAKSLDEFVAAIERVSAAKK